MVVLAFENLSYLKINYVNSEMLSLNLTDIESRAFATVLGCQIKTLPLTYLGVPINSKSLCDID